LPSLDGIRVEYYPAGPDQVFVTCLWTVQDSQTAYDQFFVFSFRSGEVGKLLYDHQKARCDSGLGPCDPSLAEWQAVADGTQGKLYPHDLLLAGVSVEGYLPELERLLVNVAGSWGRYTLALSSDHAPEVLTGPLLHQGGMRVEGMPTSLLPTGYGEYFTGDGFVDGWLNPHPDAWLQLTEMPAMFWGGMSVSLHADGVWENVRYTGSGAPGDVLFLDQAQNNLGYMLNRSGPRGGLAYAWESPIPLQDPWGMDVSEEGLLCIAYRTNWYHKGGVLVMAPDGPGEVPYKLLMEVGELGDVTDCRWGADGSLHWLATDPPRIERLPDFWVETSQLVAELPPESVPIQMVMAPGGVWDVLDANGELRGLIYLKDGRRVEARMESFDIIVDQEVRLNLGQVVYTEWPKLVAPTAHTFIRFQERPDGLVVAVPFGSQIPPPAGGMSWVFDPTTGDLWQLSPTPLVPSAGNGLAILPGGSAVDPWPNVTFPDAAEAIVPPSITAPTQGSTVTESSGGCSAAPSAQSARGLLLLTLLLCLLVRVRPEHGRRGRSTAEVTRSRG